MPWVGPASRGQLNLHALWDQILRGEGHNVQLLWDWASSGALRLHARPRQTPLQREACPHLPSGE